MPIRPYLAGEAFDPETIHNMSLVLEDICRTLNLKMIDDACTRLVARKIIDLAQCGIHDVATLRAMTLDEFKVRGMGFR
jgi:hypothetical protein